MDVADQIVVMNHAKVEQTGNPREIYDYPANEFVMGFVGPVATLNDELGAAARRRPRARARRTITPRR